MIPASSLHKSFDFPLFLAFEQTIFMVNYLLLFALNRFYSLIEKLDIRIGTIESLIVQHIFEFKGFWAREWSHWSRGRSESIVEKATNTFKLIYFVIHWYVPWCHKLTLNVIIQSLLVSIPANFWVLSIESCTLR